MQYYLVYSVFNILIMQTLIEVNATGKESIFKEIEQKLKSENFTFERTDFNRPWGGFFVIDEKHAGQFVKKYFPGSDFNTLVGDRKVSPKILVVAPHQRLSWQYHHRRSEVWRVAGGKVGIIRSHNDEQGDLIELIAGSQVVLQKGERHRLVGLEGFAFVAEIWQHTDPDHPSDEDDIVRLQDDFNRN